MKICRGAERLILYLSLWCNRSPMMLWLWPGPLACPLYSALPDWHGGAERLLGCWSMKPLKVHVCVCVSAASACVHLHLHNCACSRSVTMTTPTHNPEYQRRSSVFEFNECRKESYDNKLYLDGVGIQVTKALICNHITETLIMYWVQTM